MTRSPSFRLLAPASVALALTAVSAPAAAQAPPLSESIVIGAWTFRPSLELRLRGEIRTDPVEGRGSSAAQPSLLYDPPPGSSQWSAAYQTPAVATAGMVAERARLGLAVDRGPVTGVLVLQDARQLGQGSGFSPVFPSLAPLSQAGFGPYEAYVDVHSRSKRKVFLRFGRQRVSWGDGRLVGDNDWSPTGRSLDGVRLGFQIGDVDVQAMAVLLARPGNGPRFGETGNPRAATGDYKGSGAQLYGIDATWHILPLLNVELTGLARIVRDPAPAWLTPSDTFTFDARVFGDRRGFQYALEGAYQLGRVASYGVNRDIGAFALAARASLETSLPWHLTFGADGVYASGADGNDSGTQTRFDPILPDEYQSFNRMNLYTWSNVLAAGGWIGARPLDDLEIRGAYHYAALASASDRWVTGSFMLVGESATNTSSALGHQIDASVGYSPWEAISFQAGYSAFVFGDGAQNILAEAGRPASVQHWGYLQAIVHAP